MNKLTRQYLLDIIQGLVTRIEMNGGIGEYKGGPAFIMARAEEALSNKESGNG